MRADRSPEISLWLRATALVGALAAISRLSPRAAASGPSAGPIPLQSPPIARLGRWERWKRILINTYDEIGKDRLLAVAAGVVFFGLLAIFPAVTAFVSLYGLIAGYDTVNDHIALLAYVLPQDGVSIVHDQIERVVSKGSGQLSFGFAAGLALALWSANAGVKAMIDALNVINDREEQRNFLVLNAVSLTFTFGAIVFLLCAVGAVVAFPLVMSAFGLGSVTDTAVWMVRWPALLALILLGLSLLYRLGPSQPKLQWRWISPGILFAAFAWLAGSALLSFYLSNFADYDATYGSLGAAIGLMMWMWLTTTVVLAGAELDSEIGKLS